MRNPSPIWGTFQLTAPQWWCPHSTQTQCPQTLSLGQRLVVGQTQHQSQQTLGLTVAQVDPSTCQGLPTIVQCREWAGVSVESFSDEDLQQILDAESAIQAATLVIPVDDQGACWWPAPLIRSLLRRVQRECASRSLPLGFASDLAADFGPIQLVAWDAEIGRLESSWVRHVVA